MVKSCVHCGYCCRKAPCAYGESFEGERACAFLYKPTPSSKEWLCGRYEVIMKKEKNSKYPMFHSGCCCPLNSERTRYVDNSLHRD